MAQSAAIVSAALPSIIFHGAGAFDALTAAERFLRQAGFSAGSGCANSPTAIMFGDYLVAKWKNLTLSERAGSHGLMEGDRRDGPVTVRLTEQCPPAGVEAFCEFGGELVS